MALNDQDREWVRAILLESVTQMMLKVREGLYDAIKDHQATCDITAQGKAVVFGMGIGAACAGSGVTMLVQWLSRSV